MNTYAKAIAKEMERNEMHYQTIETDDSTLIEFSFKDSIPVEVLYDINDDSDAKIVTYPLRNIGREKKEAMRKAVEELNQKYKFVKLYLDKDNDICISYDFEFYGEDTERIGRHGVFVLIRICKIISSCLPVLLHAAYGESEEQHDEDDIFDLFEEGEDGAA